MIERINADTVYVVEWSASQRAIHTDSLSQTLSNNLSEALAGKSSDWAIVAIADSANAAHQKAKELEPMLRRTS